MAARVLLYSADAPDQEVALAGFAIDSLTERQLLWIDLSEPTAEELREVAQALSCNVDLFAIVHQGRALPSLVNYGPAFRITAQAVTLARTESPLVHEPVTLLVGRNYLVTVHEAGMEFLDGLRNREQGDSTIGVLSSESFAASLLDWLLSTYFKAMDMIIHDVDRVEVLILGERVPPRNLAVLVTARRRVADLRRSLKSHRDVFHGLTRPDFVATETPDSKAHFDALSQHYERAEDDLETARDLVIGSFELLSTRAAQKTNETMRVLTFVTVLMGLLALIAGVMGMNFQTPFFQTGLTGFLTVCGSMVAFASLAVWLAFRRSWF